MIHIARHRNIARRYLCDPLTTYIVDVDASMESKSSKNGGFCGGIVAFDISRWISFGKAEGLRLLKRNCEITSYFIHLGQDVVSRPIHNSHHSCNVISSK